VVSFIGTIGNAHGLQTLVDAAKSLTIHRDIHFLIIGEGAEKERLKLAIEAEGIGNIQLGNQQPHSEIPKFIRASDVCLVLLKRSEVFKTVIPSKMLEFMACGRPVIVGVDGVAREIVTRSGGGLYVQPENADSLGSAILRLYRDRDLRHKLGANGASFILRSMSREQTATEYLTLLEAVRHKPMAVAPVQGCPDTSITDERSVVAHSPATDL
jgi:glycosyltransferase involved in cell wall biosynthesis